MKVNKTNLLKAIDVLIKEYHDNIHEGSMKNCPLCNLYGSPITSDGIKLIDLHNRCKNCINSVFVPYLVSKIFHEDSLARATNEIFSCLKRSAINGGRGGITSIESSLHERYWVKAKAYLKGVPAINFKPLSDGTMRYHSEIINTLRRIAKEIY